MRFVAFFLLVLLALMQYQLWFGQGGIHERRVLRGQLHEIDAEYRLVHARNQQLRQSLLSHRAEPQELLSLIEVHARRELGFIKEGETFYWVVEGD